MAVLFLISGRALVLNQSFFIMLTSHPCTFQLSLGFALAEEKVSADENLSKLFYECKDYVVATCQRSVWDDKMDDLCQVISILNSCFNVSTNGNKYMISNSETKFPSEGKENSVSSYA